MRFAIDRKKWLRGEGMGDSRLLRPRDGKQCCVGQVCSQLGIPDEQLRDKLAIQTLLNGFPDVGPLAIFVDERRSCKEVRVEQDWLGSAYSINDAFDDDGDGDGERESRLSALFAENGYELVFTD